MDEVEDEELVESILNETPEWVFILDDISKNLLERVKFHNEIKILQDSKIEKK